nr:hypothetical protein [Blastocatellia bacterium]
MERLFEFIQLRLTGNGGHFTAEDIVVDTSITAGRVVRVLDLLKSQRGVPRSIRVDNGPEMTAHA